MAGEGDENFVASVLAEINQRQQGSALSDFDTKSFQYAPDQNRCDVTQSTSGKRKAPTKPKRKASSCQQNTGNPLWDLDLGEMSIQEIMDTVKAKNESASKVTEVQANDREYTNTDATDSFENTSSSNKSASEIDECVEVNGTTESYSFPHQHVDDQHIYSDPDHTFRLDLIPSTLPDRSYHRTNSSSLERANCSMEDISIVGTDDSDSSNLRASRLKTSTSVQSNLDLVGVESASPSRRGRFGGSRRSRDKNSDKDFGQFLDAAASNASSAYAKLRQLKKKAKKDILGSIPGKGGQAKTNRILDDDTRRKSHSKSDLSPFGFAPHDNVIGRSEIEKPIKSGWLKKQGGVRKTWSDRWFVLTKQCLYYYKDRDEAKLCGSIPIAGCEVDENPQINDSSCNRHLFEIIPEFGKRNQNSQTFGAATKNDKDSWIKAVKKVQSGPTSAGVFGQSLNQTVRREESVTGSHHGKKDCGKVPYVVIKCCEFIRENKGFSEEGLFRLPGHADDVQELRDAFDRGEIPTFDSRTDIHTITSLLKSYLRELPEPVVPFHMYSALIEAAKEMSAAKQHSTMSSEELNGQAVNVIKPQLEQLPEENLHLLCYLSRFLDEVQHFSTKNKMNIDNLALMFGPNILRSENLDPVTMISHSTYVQYVMSQFIRNHKHYFGDLKITQSQDFTPPSIPDVAADADRQDVSNRVNENNLINTMKSGLPIIASSQIGNGGNAITKRTSPQKPLRLSEHANRPILPPKPSVKQDSLERHDGIARISVVSSQPPNVPMTTRPVINGSINDNQRGFPAPYKFSGVASNRSSFEDMSTSEIQSSNASSPRDSTSEYIPEKVPLPPARRRKPTKDSPVRLPSMTSSSDVFDGDTTAQTNKSFPTSRTGSISGSLDNSPRERSRSAITVPRRPNVRPPPPPLHPPTSTPTDEPSHEELKESVKSLKEERLQQKGEFARKLHQFEEDFIFRMRELKLHPILNFQDSTSEPNHDSNPSTWRSGDYSTERDIATLRESIKEERQLRRAVEIQLKSERLARQAAEERNAQLMKEIERLRSVDTTGSV